MRKKTINTMKLEELVALYGILSELCQDYSRMTDNYALATGDNKFQSMPQEMYDMINERQEFYGYKNKIKDLIKSRVREELKERDNEQNKEILS